jgi:hypothetical protein
MTPDTCGVDEGTLTTEGKSSPKAYHYSGPFAYESFNREKVVEMDTC